MNRLLIWAAAAALGGAPAAAEETVIVDTARSPHALVESVGVGEVEWTDGFWAERVRVCRERSIPAMWEIMRGDHYKPFLQHFLIAAGRMEGEYHGAAWNDGDFYKWIEGACAALAAHPDPELQRHVAESVEAIAAAQREDGYLHTPVLIRQRNGDATAEPFQDRFNFEMYNMGHLMTAGCVHYRTTGRRDLLEVAERAARFLDEAFADPTPEEARNSVCPSHYMGAVELYRTTGDERYLRLAQRFLDMRKLVEEGGDDNQDRIPFVDQREAVGHAVRANYLYAGAADLYLETGDSELWTPLEAIWRNVTQKKLYVTGACGALYDGASPYGSPEQGGITRTHQAYGRNYELPNTTAHNETCAAIGAVLWNWRMFIATGEAKYVDWIELALHNAVLSGVSLDGDEYFYVNPLRNVDPLPTELRWSRTRVPFVTSYCCPPNVVRTIAEAGGYAYAKSGGALWVNLYGGGRLSTELGGEPFTLKQDTRYPWQGAVRLTVEQCGDEPLALKLRVPGWAAGAVVLLNGEPLEIVARPSSYASIERRWSPGDVVQLDLPMPPVLLEAHPLVEENRNQVALKRGPIVYCLESNDLPEGVDILEVAVPLDAQFRCRFEADLLDGVTVIEADLAARDSHEWNSLYRPVTEGQARTFRARFVPYYAWGNRGESEMSVWLPRE